jgi:hypothetical protein
MAQKVNTERKEEAKRTLAQARWDLSAEANWLRRQLNPKLAAHRVLDNHTIGVLVTTFALGLGMAWMMFRHRHGGDKKETYRPTLPKKVKEEAPKRGLLGMALKAAVPLAIKLATSKPVITRVLGKVQEHLAHRARSRAF